MKLPLSLKQAPFVKSIGNLYRRGLAGARRLLAADVYIGKYIGRVPDGSIVFFPCRQTAVCCGIAGIVTFKNKKVKQDALDLGWLEDLVRQIETSGYRSCDQADRWYDCYLGGNEKMDALWGCVQALKTDAQFYSVFSDQKAQDQLRLLAKRLEALTATESKWLTEQMGHLPADRVDLIFQAIEKLKDISWSLKDDILANMIKTRDLLARGSETPSASSLRLFKKLNAVLNSIDRLEVRGRDSAGISIMFVFEAPDYQKIEAALDKAGLRDQFKERCEPDPLINAGINCHPSTAADGK